MLLAFVWAAVVASPTSAADEKLQFNRDIRPILTDNCLACHGPDKNKREAEMRLDVREDAIEHEAFVPGNVAKSELVKRIFNDDPDKMMPPPKSHKKLTAAQKETLKRWIAEGAEYQGHWAYLAPVRPAVPAGQQPVDFFVRQHLAKVGLKAAPEADRRTLIRRLYFDLVGLPPKPEEVEAFVNDKDPQAYAKIVERVLASPHFGERMAIEWLDLVRFADTIGYHSDNPRNVWPYRDYVIRSFNENKRFDQFTLEQLAGDLLPGSTLEQKVGSAFNRLLLSTEEGGAQAKDYEARMLGDRVRAVGTVWLGQTIGCCQCHDHKFDPFKSKDFYSMGAFFADIQEPILGGREPGINVASPEQEAELAKLKEAAAAAQAELDAAGPDLTAAFEGWQKVAVEEAAKQDEKKPTIPKDIADILKKEAKDRDAGQKAKLLAHFKSVTPLLADLRNRLTAANKAVNDLNAKLPKCIVSVSGGRRTVRILPRGNWQDESGPTVEAAVPGFLPQPKLAEGQKPTRLDLAQWLISPEHPLTARVFVNRMWKQLFGIGLSKTLDDLGSQGEWPTHPELLDWLAVEFREGGTSASEGSASVEASARRGTPWDIKHLIRTIVLSDTYRQSSVAPAELLTRDPENRELVRQGRFRFEAELVRDNALAISGLLVAKIGGPSVKPYQPDGYWENLNFPARTWQPDQGENQYRRGLYTWWQRSFLHPSMLAFDAPPREECAADRPRSNIPQQALVLLNDPTYVETARAFAGRIVKEGGSDVDARITWAWRQALQRTPTDKERAVAKRVFEKHQKDYAADAKAVEAVLKVGFAPMPEGLDRTEVAAWTSVARVVLNLHETITRN